MSAPIIEVENVSKRFDRKVGALGRAVRRLTGKTPPAAVRAVDGAGFSIAEGEVVGLVGESGCGKSTLGRMVAGLIAPSKGDVRYRGTPYGSGGAPLKVQMIFQNPQASLNARMTARDIIGEAPRLHGLVDRKGYDGFVETQMLRAGLDPAHKLRYPHEFSGGQCQRIGIARALAVAPDIIVCDESVAALDVSIQAQILNLFMDLRDQLGLSYLFISHDLGVVEHISDRVLIMYLGRIVETAPVTAIFRAPNHPYTQALLDDVPRIGRGRRTFRAITGEPPSPLNPPRGCHFHPRCPRAMAICANEPPRLSEIAPGHSSACHLNGRR